jgi:acyl-CoA synthetase (AMP-forming)/AMP-acid ligase II
VHPAAIAAEAPDRPAIVMAGSGATLTYRELDERSNQLAHAFRERGVEKGGSIAILMENHPLFLVAAWAAQRSGLRYTAVNRHLSAAEAAYIIDDCDAEVLVSSAAMAPVLAELTADDLPKVRARLVADGDVPGCERLEEVMAALPTTPVADECEGDWVLYSSGTTGRPKGIRRPITYAPMGEGPLVSVPLLRLLGAEGGDVYLSPAPQYHAAPLGWSLSAQRLGMTVVVLERFDPVACLEAIQRHGVTHAQLVPTMFVRMLKLPDEERLRFDTSSLKAAVHAAAPCPIEVKERMIEWWGPVICEYWSSTEGAGATFVTAEESLAKPGTVGRSLGTPLHIVDEEGNELPAGQVGQIWAEVPVRFEYHNDPQKTEESRDPRGWVTVGDVGYLDEDGYLFLTDRASYMIISGGVNIYPQEAENVLTMHPKVADVAVIGVPDEDLGEAVKAVVQPVDLADAGPELEEELLEFCRSRLSAYKCPRSIDFEAALPRLDTGKLYKRLLRDRYWAKA